MDVLISEMHLTPALPSSLAEIADNILTAGIWQKYAARHQKKKKKENDSDNGQKPV